jgi:tRNA pseudouridine38-40 synthase
LLQEGLRSVEGEHDFAAFQATGTDIVSTRRTMLRTELLPEVRGSLDLPLLCLRFEATGFLRKMVRFLVGTLLEIASGKRDPGDLGKALETGQRQYVGTPAAARGLFLEKVKY